MYGSTCCARDNGTRDCTDFRTLMIIMIAEIDIRGGDGCLHMRIFAKQPIVWAGPLSFLYNDRGKADRLYIGPF